MTPPPSHRLDEEGFFSVAPATGRGSHSGAAFVIPPVVSPHRITLCCTKLRDSIRGFFTQNSIMLYEAASGWPRGPRVGDPRADRHADRGALRGGLGGARPHCCFREGCTEYASGSGMNQMSGRAQRQCGRALGGARPRTVALHNRSSTSQTDSQTYSAPLFLTRGLAAGPPGARRGGRRVLRLRRQRQPPAVASLSCASVYFIRGSSMQRCGGLGFQCPYWFQLSAGFNFQLVVPRVVLREGM